LTYLVDITKIIQVKARNFAISLGLNSMEGRAFLKIAKHMFFEVWTKKKLIIRDWYAQTI